MDSMPVMAQCISLKSQLKKARAAYKKADKLLQEVFDSVEAIIPCPELVPTSAENADNLAEAISCFVQYGEYDVDSIVEELVEELVGEAVGVDG